MLKRDLVNLISAGYAAFLQPARTPDSIITQLFSDLNVGKCNGGYALNKPLLLLIALARCYHNQSRLAPYRIYEEFIANIANSIDKKVSALYPFGRLVADNLWEISSQSSLSTTASGDLYRSELISYDVLGGFTGSVYEYLISNKDAIFNITDHLFHKYFPVIQHATLKAALGLPQSPSEVRDCSSDMQKRASVVKSPDTITFQSQEDAVKVIHNPFIAYLNSLHNLGAGGANALAETQAMNRFFGSLYQPFPIVKEAVLPALLNADRVVVLTGHAGDGKSTIALDVFKFLREFPQEEPLIQPLREREPVMSPRRQVTLVKDMSELGAQIRLQYLEDAFGQPGSWLVISNTGPLLDSLAEYAKKHSLGGDIESDVLEKLDTPYGQGSLDVHSLSGFSKPLVVFNLSRLDNVALGARVLNKMVEHPGWDECAGCLAEIACPLRLNRSAMQSIGLAAEQRVRWVYQRLTRYEQRLTLRQIIGHLALSLTGNMDCREAQRLVEDSTAEGQEKGLEGLTKILFSESFFGYRNGRIWDRASSLQAVGLAQRLSAGGPVAVDYERQLAQPGANGIAWADIPSPLAGLFRHWQVKANNSAGVPWRFALRRLLYFFAQPSDKCKAALFYDTFLRSPKLRDFDVWQSKQQLTLSTLDKNKLRRACLWVLLECYSGFGVNQFHNQDRLYLCLRRPDRVVVQPTQWVVAALPFDEFELGFDESLRLPELRFRQGQAVLKLDLPLLDYIHARDAGELGGELAQIHWTQLEAFRAELLKVVSTVNSPEEVTLLRVDIEGQVHRHRYILDLEHRSLEVDA